MNNRLPSHIEVTALLRMVQSQGGFSMLLHRGDREQGAILLTIRTFAGASSICERLPQATGPARWSVINPTDIQTDQSLNEYLNRRVAQDPDLWTIELTVPEVERFVSDLSRQT